MALIRKPEETVSSGNTGRNVPSDTHAAKVGYYPYNGLAGLSGQTQDQLGKYQSGYKQSDAVTNAQQQLGKYQQGYKPSDTVTAAMQRLQQIQDAKPQGYNSKYGAQLDEILQQIGQPNDFRWDFNGDELFRTYADIYSRKGRQAMENAIGNASALTGGYGNSYGQQVGQQTYDEYMNDLYGVGMDLYDRAWQRNQADRADLFNRMGALQSADQTDYGRYRDTVGDWQTELGYWTDQANNERNFDYGQWGDMLNYWANQAANERNFDYGQYQDQLAYWNDLAARENQDYWTGENFIEGQRQYDTTMAENRRQYDTSMEENRRQYDTSFAENQRQFNEQLAENIRQYNESLAWDKLSTEQKNALSWAQSLLAAGQEVPNSLLQQAGLSIIMTPTGPQVVQDMSAMMTGSGPSTNPAAGVGGYTPEQISELVGMYTGNKVAEGVSGFGQAAAAAIAAQQQETPTVYDLNDMLGDGFHYLDYAFTGNPIQTPTTNGTGGQSYTGTKGTGGTTIGARGPLSPEAAAAAAAAAAGAPAGKDEKRNRTNGKTVDPFLYLNK